MSEEPSPDARSIAQRAVESAKPQEQFAPASLAPEDAPLEPDASARFLTRLMVRSPFMDAFIRSGERMNSGRTSEARVRAHKREHPRLFLTAHWSDYLLRAVVIVLLLTLTTLILWKAIAPIPPLFEQPGSQPTSAASP